MEKWIKRQVVGNTFVLNTKSVCFLCLIEVEERTNVNCFDKGGGNQVVVKVESSEQVVRPPSIPKVPEATVSLSSICGYLGISCADVFRSVLGEGGPQEERLFERISSFSVTICDNCRGAVVSKLSELCLQLELLRGKEVTAANHQELFWEMEGTQASIRDRLHLLKDTLEDSGRDQDRLDKFRYKLLMPVEMVNGNIAEMLRKEITQKCVENFETKMELISPDVLGSTSPTPPSAALFGNANGITVSTPPKISLPSKSSSFPERLTAGPSENPTRSEPTPSDEDEDEDNWSLEDAPPPKPLRFPTITPGLPEGRICNLCQPPRTFKDTPLKYHTWSHHVEKFFPEATKLPATSPDHFKIFCDYTVFTEVNSCEKIVSCPTEPIRKSYTCPHCDETFKWNTGFRYHLIFGHMERLAEKVLELQATVPVEELKEMLTPVLDGSRWISTCDGCGKQYMTYSAFDSHRKKECPASKHFQMGVVIPKVNKCRACGILYHRPRNTPSDLLESCDDEDVKLVCDFCLKQRRYQTLDRNRKCGDCGEGFKNNFQLGLHKMSCDKKKVPEKKPASSRQKELANANNPTQRSRRLRIKDGCSFKCGRCGSRFRSENILLQHKGTACCKKEAKCSECPAVFKSAWSLSRHMSQKHSSTGK